MSTTTTTAAEPTPATTTANATRGVSYVRIAASNPRGLHITRGRLTAPPTMTADPPLLAGLSIVGSVHRPRRGTIAVRVTPLVHLRHPPAWTVATAAPPPGWEALGEEKVVAVNFFSEVEKDTKMSVVAHASSKRIVATCSKTTNSTKSTTARGVALPSRPFDVVVDAAVQVAVVPEWAAALLKGGERAESFVASAGGMTKATHRAVLAAFDVPALVEKFHIESIVIGRRRPLEGGWSLYQTDATVSWEGTTPVWDDTRRWTVERLAEDVTLECATALVDILDKIESQVPVESRAEESRPATFVESTGNSQLRGNYIGCRKSTSDSWGLRFAKGTTTVISLRDDSPFISYENLVNSTVQAVNGEMVSGEEDMIERMKAAQEVMWLSCDITLSTAEQVTFKRSENEKWGLAIGPTGIVIATAVGSPSDGNIPLGSRILTIDGHPFDMDKFKGTEETLTLVYSPPKSATLQRLTPGESWGIGFERKREGPPVVTKVVPNSPAHRAGVVVGCVIAEVAGKAMTSPDDLIAMLSDAARESVLLKCYTSDTSIVRLQPPKKAETASLGQHAATRFTTALLREAGHPNSGDAVVSEMCASKKDILSMSYDDFKTFGLSDRVASMLAAPPGAVGHMFGFQTRRVGGLNFVCGGKLIHSAAAVEVDVRHPVADRNGEVVIPANATTVVAPVNDAVALHMQNDVVKLETNHFHAQVHAFADTILMKDAEFEEWWVAYVLTNTRPRGLRSRLDNLTIDAPVYLYCPYGGRALWESRPDGTLPLDVDPRGPPLRLWPGAPFFRSGRVVGALRSFFASDRGDRTVKFKCFENLFTKSNILRVTRK